MHIIRIVYIYEDLFITDRVIKTVIYETSCTDK